MIRSTYQRHYALLVCQRNLLYLLWNNNDEYLAILEQYRVVNPISTTLATKLQSHTIYGGCKCGTPYYYMYIYYTRSDRHGGLLPRPWGHRWFSSVVTDCFWIGHVMILLVAALNMAVTSWPLPPKFTMMSLGKLSLSCPLDTLLQR